MNELIAIPKESAQAILNYLGTKPYTEVYQLVEVLQSAKAVRIEPKPEKSNEPANPGNTA